MNEKRRRILRVVLSILGVLVLLPAVAMADPVQLTLTGTEHGWSMGGVYTSPYKIRINGNSQDVLALACDDFTTDINFNYSWYANIYGLSDVTDDGPQKFPKTSGDVAVYFPSDKKSTQYSPNDAYEAAAFLAEALLYSPVRNDQHLSGIYSYAIWQIFYDQAYLGYGGNHLSQADVGAVDATMDWAFAQVAGHASLAHALNIYTPCATMEQGPGPCSTGSPNQGASQEFLGMTPLPEGSALAVLAFDLIALLGGVFLVRKRILGNAGAPN